MVQHTSPRRLSKRTRWRFRQLGCTNAQAEALAACGVTPGMLLAYLDSGHLEDKYKVYRWHRRFAARVDAMHRNIFSQEPVMLSALGQLATDAAPAGIPLDEALWWCVVAGVPKDEFTLVSALPESIRSGNRYHCPEILFEISHGVSLGAQRSGLAAIIGSGAVVTDPTGDYAIGVSTGGVRMFETATLDSVDTLEDIHEEVPADLQALIALGGLADFDELYRDCEQFLQQFVEPVIGRQLTVDPTGPPPPDQLWGEPFWRVVHSVGRLRLVDAMAAAYRDAYDDGRLSDSWAPFVLTD